MSGGELATRLGVIQQSVPDLEHSEFYDSIKLDTLRRAADALDCDLVYALVPRTSLEDAVAAQARRKARAHLSGIAHHSRLEDQVISDADTDAQLDQLARSFVDRRGLWSE
jgi:predicted DNA-binding mobile mystery protein A